MKVGGRGGKSDKGIRFICSKKRMWWNNFLLCCYKNEPDPFIQGEGWSPFQIKPASLSNNLSHTSCSIQRWGRGSSISDTPEVRYQNLTECVPSGRNCVSVEGFVWDNFGSPDALHYVSKKMSIPIIELSCIYVTKSSVMYYQRLLV